MLTYLIQGLALGFPAAMTPGPLQAYFLSQTMLSGWRRTLPAALAPILSDGPIILLVLLLLKQIPPWYLHFLRIAGGIFIIYLAIRAYTGWRQNRTDNDLPPESSSRGLLQATLTNLLNPNPYIFWAFVAGPILLDAWRQSSIQGLFFLVGFYGTLIGGFSFLILIFAGAHRFGTRTVSYLTLVAIFVLVFFGVYQLGNGLVDLANSVA